jgi:hypothetical protein
MIDYPCIICFDRRTIYVSIRTSSRIILWNPFLTNDRNIFPEASTCILIRFIFFFFFLIIMNDIRVRPSWGLKCHNNLCSKILHYKKDIQQILSTRFSSKQTLIFSSCSASLIKLSNNNNRTDINCKPHIEICR